LGQVTSRASKPFWEKPLSALTRTEWESLCDGCGKCCLHKLEDADTGDVYPTNVACKLLDGDTARCTHYRGRRAFVPDCIRLDADNVERFSWLPSTCAYRLRAAGKPLPDWHHLICGDREAVHRAGQSVRGWTVAEAEAGDLEWHVIDDDL
jgi:uncharacterized cysteine cluster protein YcgN (CxxCxxCC family)